MRQAYTFASKAHDGQERMDGKPYISHPLEVARILVEMNMDVDSICAGLMHDVLEDCNIEKRNQSIHNKRKRCKSPRNSQYTIKRWSNYL